MDITYTLYPTCDYRLKMRIPKIFVVVCQPVVTENILVEVACIILDLFLQHSITFSNSSLNFPPKIQYKIPLILWFKYCILIRKTLPYGFE